MSIGFRLLLRLLFHRPLVTVLLLLVYLITALLLVVIGSDKRAAVIATMGAFATVGLSAVLTERIARFSLAAGSIGLPDHALFMRRAQYWFLGLFVAVPAAAAVVAGMAPLTAAALLVASTAAGIVLTTYGGWWIVVVPIVGRFPSVESWLQSPVVQGLALLAGGWLVSRWTALPARIERVGGLLPAALADAKHEPPATAGDEDPQATSERSAGQSRNLEDAFALGAADLDASWMPPNVLAVCLRYSVVTGWRGVLNGSLTALVVLFAWRLYRGAQPDIAAYLTVTAGCCLVLVGRLEGVLQQWMRTPIEQSLLRLTPRWPEARAIKWAVLQSLLMVQRGAVSAWVVVSLVAWTVGWIGTPELLIGGMGVLGTALAFTGTVVATLARRRVRELQLATVASVLTVAIGVVLVLFGEATGSHHATIGAAMMVGPPVLSLAWYLGAPLRLPLNVDARALKSQP